MHFNKIAHFYDDLKQIVFGNKLHVAECYFLHNITSGSNVLIIGGGTGDYLIEILKLKMVNSIVFLDLSSKMIELCKQKVRNINPDWLLIIDFRIGSIEMVKDDEFFNVICTNFFLDMFSNKSLSEILPRLHKRLVKNGKWQYTDFQNSSNLYNQILLKFMYLFFGYMCKIEASKLPNTDFFFKKLNLKIETEDTGR